VKTVVLKMLRQPFSSVRVVAKLRYETSAKLA